MHVQIENFISILIGLYKLQALVPVSFIFIAEIVTAKQTKHKVQGILYK